MQDASTPPNFFYYIFNRGVNRQTIFFNPGNWSFFLGRLRKYFDPSQATILTYCLMPNHYHLLVNVKCEDFGSAIMHPFGISYTKAINKQQNRVGPLFQGKYQARLIERDAELLNLSRYIHLNPVAAGLVESPEDWEYSSYRDFIGLRDDPLSATNFILAQFPSCQSYAEFVCEQQVESKVIAQAIKIDGSPG